MFYRLWTKKQVEGLYEAKFRGILPKEVLVYIKEKLKTLDQYYGQERKINDDGGYLLLILPGVIAEDQIVELLSKEYNMTVNEREFRDTIIVADSMKRSWYGELYIVGTEYAITFVYSRECEGMK